MPDWDGSGSWFKFNQMQRTNPVHQQVQVQTDATDWEIRFINVQVLNRITGVQTDSDWDGPTVQVQTDSGLNKFQVQPDETDWRYPVDQPVDPVDQQVQVDATDPVDQKVQPDATDWDGSGSTSATSLKFQTDATDWDGSGSERVQVQTTDKFKFKLMQTVQMQRTGMDPVHQQVQVQTDATDWDGSTVDQQVQVQTDATDWDGSG